MSDETKRIVAELPEGHDGRPFVLLWAEQKAVDVLKSENLVFSPAIDGLSNPVVAETLETTGDPENAGDTTF